jgi:hypothetical protein
MESQPCDQPVSTLVLSLRGETNRVEHTSLSHIHPCTRLLARPHSFYSRRTPQHLQFQFTVKYISKRMSSQSNITEEERRSKPCFSGNTMPLNIDPNLSLDHGVGDEVTRRVGVFQPSFEPVSSFQPPMMVSTESPYSKGSVTRKEAVVSSSKAPAPLGALWRLDSVPTLPEFHPLERTSVFIPHVITASEITARISDVMRERSIEASYHNDKAKAVCSTMDGVEFRVRLYRGRGSYHHGIIVEVQRRFGTSISFGADCKAILDAAEGKVVPPPLTSETSSLPLVVSDFEDDFDSPIVDGKSSLSMISKMLNDPCYDSHFLALQTLLSLTDASKMGSTTARIIANELFRLDNDNEIGAKILSLVIDKQNEDSDFKLRPMALHVAANAFHAVEGKFPTMLKEQLRPVILQDLRCAKEFPRNAVQAARIMQYFVPEDNGSDVYSALEIAHQVGSSRNASLERQVRVCLDKIGQ